MCSTLGGGTTRQMTQANQRDVPCHMTLYLAIRGKSRGFAGVSHVFAWELAGYWSVQPLCPLFCFLFFCLSFTSSAIILSFYLDPRVFLLLFSLFSFPIPFGRERSSSCVLLHSPPGLTPNMALSWGFTQTLSPLSCPCCVGWLSKHWR